MPIEVKKNIVLVDDNILVREGLKILFEKLGPYKVSSEFDPRDLDRFKIETAIPFEVDVVKGFYPILPFPDLLDQIKHLIL